MVDSFNLNIVGSCWKTNQSGVILRKDQEHLYLQYHIQHLLARGMVGPDLVTLSILRDQLVVRLKRSTKRTKLSEKMLRNILLRKWNLLRNHKNKKKRVFVPKQKSCALDSWRITRELDWKRKKLILRRKNLWLRRKMSWLRGENLRCTICKRRRESWWKI